MLPRLAALVLLVVLAQTRGCGLHDDPEKGPGEACTRSTECRGSLVCQGGVCAEPSLDSGPTDSAVRDSSAGDSSLDSSLDSAPDALDVGDASADSDAPAADADASDAADGAPDALDSTPDSP